MSRSYDQNCPIACALDLVGDRWTLLIVRELLRGPRRFSELRQSLRGIAPNLLSSRLQKLEAGGVAVRRVVDDRPVRTQYELTAAGRELWIPLRAIGIWGTRHVQRRVKRVHRDCGTELRVRMHCDACDVDLHDDSEATMARRD